MAKYSIRIMKYPMRFAHNHNIHNCVDEMKDDIKHSQELKEYFINFYEKAKNMVSEKGYDLPKHWRYVVKVNFSGEIEDVFGASEDWAKHGHADAIKDGLKKSLKRISN